MKRITVTLTEDQIRTIIDCISWSVEQKERWLESWNRGRMPHKTEVDARKHYDSKMFQQRIVEDLLKAES